jgi:hypothetical protein
VVRTALTIAAHVGQPISNAVSESLAAKIETIRRRACGLRNREQVKTAIHFHCGGLDLDGNPFPPHRGNIADLDLRALGADGQNQ